MWNMPHDHNHDLVWTNTMLWYIYYKIQIYTILYQHHVESDLFTLNKSLKVCWSLVSLLLINNNKSKTKTKTWSWSEPHWTYLPASKIQWHLTVKQLKERLDSYRYGDRTTKCKSIVAAISLLNVAPAHSSRTHWRSEVSYELSY